MRYVLLGLLCTALSATAYLPTTAQAAAPKTIEDPPSSHDQHEAVSQDRAARSAAQQRAKAARERSGATTDLHEDPLLDPMPIQFRERSIPRKVDLDGLPSPGCQPSDPSIQKPSGCMGCGQCAGPAHAASSMSALGQLLAALAALLTLGVLAYLLHTIWQKRRYPTHRALEDHDLLAQARALSETAVEDAAAQQDFNAAIHALFLRTLLRLHDAGYTIEPHWTPRQVARRVSTSQDIQKPLAELVHIAERARFANHRSTREEFEHAQRAATSVDDEHSKERVK